MFQFEDEASEDRAMRDHVEAITAEVWHEVITAFSRRNLDPASRDMENAKTAITRILVDLFQSVLLRNALLPKPRA